MLETRFPQRVSPFAAQSPQLQAAYMTYGDDLRRHFDPTRR